MGRRELPLTLELLNARGGEPVVNEPIVFEQVNNGSFPFHPITVQEGYNDSESYQGPEESKVCGNDEPKGYYKYKDFTTFKSSSSTGKKDPVGVMDCISEIELAFITSGCTGNLKTTYIVRQIKGIIIH